MHANKPEKFRYGRAPSTPVSAEQVTVSANTSGPASAGNTTNSATETAASGSDVQPLGPDLEHPILITQPKEVKRRFSDEARTRAQAKTREKRVKGHQAKQTKPVKPDNAKPTPTTTAEAENAKVQNAALGLNGPTAAKKKKAKRKKITVRNGEKIRLSDEKKKQEQNKGKSASDVPSSQTSSSSTGQPQ